jgi:iron complex transport system substrate-binding protein
MSVTRRRAKRVRAVGPLIVAAALVMSACGRFDNEDGKLDHERRIVSISKQYTEIIYALGAEEDLVAVDVSSVYPPAATELPTVGYHRALSLEGLLAARPTLIMHNGLFDIGPEHVVRQLQSLEIPLQTFEGHEADIEGTKALIRDMGAHFGKEARAAELNAKLDADLAHALEASAASADTPSVVIIHFGRASNVYLTVTKNSVGGRMIEWAGGRMAIGGEGGMKGLTSPEVIAKADPDVILLTDFGYDRLAGRSEILALPGVSSTRAARTGRIFRVEEHDLIYLGPRTGENVNLLRELIHQPGSPD